MIKNLTKHGNSKAIIIEKAMLVAAGLDGDALFQMTINPNGGLIIQSIETIEKEKDQEGHKKNVGKVLKKHSKLFERLADQ